MLFLFSQEKSEARVPPVPHAVPENAAHSPHLLKGPGFSEMPNAHSLESGYGSHPGSASLMPDQSSPFGNMPTNHANKHQTPEVHLEGMSLEDRKDRLPKLDPERRVKTTPAWTKDLMHRIESLIHEQNEKYNLGSSTSKPSRLERLSTDSISPPYEEDDNSKPPVQPLEVKKEQTPEDLEDGECSGEDMGDEQSPELIQNILPSRDEVDAENPPLKRAGTPPVEVLETSQQRRSRTPSPSFPFPPGHSPTRVPGAERPLYERHERFPSPPPPEDFYPHRMRPPSPGRPPVEFNDRFRYGARPHSPPFAHHRRHSPPFDGHRRISRSPGYDHHRHHYSPPRRRPPSPGYMRHHELRPGHPEYLRRRTPSPVYGHHRRSPSPVRKFTGPLIRREFDYSPPRHERIYHSPREMERHHGRYSPRHMEHERYRKRSPGGHRSPDLPKHRDHRDLPPEFRERWSHKRSPSPRHSR